MGPSQITIPVFCLYETGSIQPSDLPWVPQGRFNQLLIRERKKYRKKRRSSEETTGQLWGRVLIPPQGIYITISWVPTQVEDGNLRQSPRFLENTLVPHCQPIGRKSAHSGRFWRLWPPPLTSPSKIFHDQAVSLGLVIWAQVQLLSGLPASWIKQTLCSFQHLFLKYWFWSSKQPNLGSVINPIFCYWSILIS